MLAVKRGLSLATVDAMVDEAVAGLVDLANLQTITGDKTFAKVGFNGVVPVARAAAITAPVAASALYTQSQVQSLVDAVNAIRVALTNVGITS